MDVVLGPAPRRALPANLAPTLRGEAVAVCNRDGVHYGYIAWTEPYGDAEGSWVDVVSTRDWWAHELLGAAPSRVQRWPIHAVYVV